MVKTKKNGAGNPPAKSTKSAKKAPGKSNKTPRRVRSDSVETAINIAQAVGATFDPPAHIRMLEKQMPFFNSIIAEFPDFEWTDHQIEIACMLAQAMCELEDQMFWLIQEGTMIEVTSTKKSKRKYMAVNPRKAACQSWSGTVLSLRRSLSLHARARGGEARDIGKRRTKTKDIEQNIKKFSNDPDDLLARPKTVQ